MIRGLSAAALLLAIAAPAIAAKPRYELTGKVVKIADGDTMTVLDGANVQHKIRLAGIDAPEKGQPFGTNAREVLADKVFGQTVRIEVIDVDRYRREVGRIYLGDRFINVEMVRDGFAGRYVMYDRVDLSHFSGRLREKTGSLRFAHLPTSAGRLDPGHGLKVCHVEHERRKIVAVMVGPPVAQAFADVSVSVSPTKKGERCDTLPPWY